MAPFQWPGDLSSQVDPVGPYTPAVAILSIVPHLISPKSSPQTYALLFDSLLLFPFSHTQLSFCCPQALRSSSDRLVLRASIPTLPSTQQKTSHLQIPYHFQLSRYVANPKMPFKWDAESERALLLLVITEMSPPAGAIWPNVAERLGRDLSGNACRYYAVIALFFESLSSS